MVVEEDLLAALDQAAIELDEAANLLDVHFPQCAEIVRQAAKTKRELVAEATASEGAV